MNNRKTLHSADGMCMLSVHGGHHFCFGEPCFKIYHPPVALPLQLSAGEGGTTPVYGRGQNDETVCKIADGGSIHDFGVVKAAPSTRNPQVWGYDFGVVPLPGGVHQGRDRGVNKFQLPVHLAAANVRGIKIQTRFYAELIWGSVTMTTESSPDTCV